MQKVLAENGIRVPCLYDNLPEKGYYLQEDLGNITLIKRLASIDSDAQELHLYKKSIDLLSNLHKIPQDKYRKFSFTGNMFDEQKLQSEVEFTYKYFIEEQLNHRSKSDKKVVLKGFQEINKDLAKEKMVVTHRDFHSRNIMVKEENLVVIDFQDARMGIPQYDLVSLLEDCYYQLGERNRNVLKEYYLEQFSEIKKWQSKEKFEYLYDLSILQRTFKAIGSFSYLFIEQKRPFLSPTHRPCF